MAFELIHQFKHSTPLIKMVFGETTVFCTTSKTPFLFKGDLYFPEPGIEIKLPRQGGGVEQEAMKLTLPLKRSEVNSDVSDIATSLASVRSSPPLRIEVMEHIRSSDTDARVIYLFSGIAKLSRRNPSGKAGIVELDLYPELLEGLEDVSLGRRCDPECDYATFGGVGCYLDNSMVFDPSEYSTPFKRIRNLWVVAQFFNPSNPREVTVTVDTSQHPGATNALITSQPRDWWLRSQLIKDNLSIPIQEWRWNETTGSTNIFLLNRLPPSSWGGSSVFLKLDCSRSKQACLDRNNITRFGALGYGIPAYNPTLDDNGG